MTTNPLPLPGEDEYGTSPLTTEQIAGLYRLYDGPGPRPGEDDDPGQDEDDDPGGCQPPYWLDLPPDEQARALGCDADDLRPPPAGEAIAAGFTHRHGPRNPAGTGFESGAPLDVMQPGIRLGEHVIRARRQLPRLSDDELIGALGASQRQQSLHQEITYSLVAELDRRRTRPDGREGEHVDAELGAELRLTPRAAQDLLFYSLEIQRLEPVRALLAAGVIDPKRAQTIARHLEPLSDEHAAEVLEMILPRVGEMTTGWLSQALTSAVKKVDPEGARRRKQEGQEDARVECYAEDDGNAALSGRHLEPAQAIAADKNIRALAQTLKDQGTEGTLEQLCAAVFLALLSCQPLPAPTPAPAPASNSQPGTPASPASSGQPGSGTSASPDATNSTGAADGASTDASTGTDAGTGTGTGAGSTGTTGGTGQAPAATGTPVSAGVPAGLSGSVHLTMPASAFFGQDDAPGQVGGFGAADADTCRELAGWLAEGGKARWCITLTDRHGRPVAHGCARAGPGPPASRNTRSWLATITISPFEAGACEHRREVAGYRIPDSLRHIIKVRSPRCGFPGCRRPAGRCDDDHTTPYHLGGKSCECNLYPLCRYHHRCKQRPGWHLEQPEPGQLIWTTPSGRRYAKTTEPYPV
jgi:Domain of unknown function (DUF222)